VEQEMSDRRSSQLKSATRSVPAPLPPLPPCPPAPRPPRHEWLDHAGLPDPPDLPLASPPDPGPDIGERSVCDTSISSPVLPADSSAGDTRSRNGNIRDQSTNMITSYQKRCFMQQGRPYPPLPPRRNQLIVRALNIPTEAESPDPPATDPPANGAAHSPMTDQVHFMIRT
jgi:hypothetical protein